VPATTFQSGFTTGEPSPGQYLVISTVVISPTSRGSIYIIK
jgi:hypothetical protein